MHKLILMTLLSSALCSCEDNTPENTLEKEMMEPDESGTALSKEEIFNLIETSSTPVEMSMVIKNADYDFSDDLLLPTDDLDKFSTSYEKATAMGAYGTDIGFLNIYNKLHIVPDYLMVTRNLSKGLDLDSFFDFQKMMDMSENIENIDSLIQLSTESFNEMEAHLRRQGRDEISLLIVFGTWLEGTYLTAEFAQKFNDADMVDRVAEQKEFVTEIDRIFTASDDRYFHVLSEELKPLVELFDQVEVEEVLREPTVKEENGEMIIIDNSELRIHADEGVLQNLIEEIKSLRIELLKS